MHLRRLAVAGTAVLTVVVSAPPALITHATATPATTVTTRPGDPLVERPLRGPRALERLQETGLLDEAARRRGTTSEALARVLADPTTRMTDQGRVLYAEPIGTADTPDTAPESAGAPVSSAFEPVVPLADTFTLRSRPGSSRTIYLDFTGDTVADTWWNDTQWGLSLPEGYYAAWSIDGDRSTFNAQERTAIQEVWARVAEDFAPFDVDVTTRDPGTAALERTSSGDTTYGVQVLITPGTSAADVICGGGCSGVAWMDVFDEVQTSTPKNGPAWVMTDLTWGSAWEIADIASHEAGHTLALEHDGYGTATYYGGRGVWTPLMGGGSNPLTQWSNGDYTSSTTTQDDLAVIAASGAPRVADDHGDTPTDPAVGDLGSGASGTASGVIGDRHDQDVVRYAHGACTVTATVATATPGPDLDVRLRVLDAAGAVLASVNPTTAAASGHTLTGTGATWSGELPAGTTYFEVDGVGQGSMPTQGYSDYGSVGRWTMSVSGCAAPTDGATVPTAPQSLVLDDDPATGDVAASWAAPSSNGGSALTGYTVTVTDGQGGSTTRSLTGRSTTFTGLAADRTHTVSVVARNGVGAGPAATGSVTFGPRVAEAPGALALRRTSTPGRATLAWSAPTQTWGLPVTAYLVDSAVLGLLPALVTGTSLPVTGLSDGQSASYTVRAVTLAGDGRPRTATLTYHAPTRPGRAGIGRAYWGARGGTSTARATWSRPASDGGSPITGYRVAAFKYDAAGRVVRTFSSLRPASARSWTATLPRGRYRFRVAAVNAIGRGTSSAWSTYVRAR